MKIWVFQILWRKIVRIMLFFNKVKLTLFIIIIFNYYYTILSILWFHLWVREAMKSEYYLYSLIKEYYTKEMQTSRQVTICCIKVILFYAFCIRYCLLLCDCLTRAGKYILWPIRRQREKYCGTLYDDFLQSLNYNKKIGAERIIQNTYDLVASIILVLY